jgi:starvation-inducible DNA-binding protein
MMATLTAHKTFNTSVDLKESTRQQIFEILNQRLADSLDLKLQTKHAHWNVKGPDFIQFHELFDDLAPHFDEAADLIAERITALGGVANGTTRQAAAATSIPEYDLNAVEGLEHVKALSERLAKFANQLRGDIDRADELGDAGTTDLLTQISRQADKDLWFLEAHLQR